MLGKKWIDFGERVEAFTDAILAIIMTIIDIYLTLIIIIFCKTKANLRLRSY